MLLLLILAPILVGYVQGIPQINTVDARVREDVAVGAFAFQIDATDSNGAALTYRFATGGEFGEGASYFSIDPKTGRVNLALLLDRETKPVIRVQVEVTSDETVRAPIPVIVEDANDNSPVFQHGPFNEEVPENTPLGTVLFRANATDKDFNTAAAVTYSISSAIPKEGLSLFSINPSSGEVTLIGGLNFTGKSRFYQLEINATDGGGPLEGKIVYQSNTIGAFIKVVDVPDLDPQFLQLPYSGNVKEHAAIGHSVFQVEAFDPDTEVNDIILYSISNSNAQGLFTVDQNSGIISVHSMIDRESLLDIDAEVILQVMATEANPNVNGIHANSTAEVKITILDINDNKPLFYACDSDPCDFATEALSFSGSVDEGSSRGVTVAGLNMAVRDLDDAQSGNAVTNLHLEGPDKNAFSVMVVPLSSFVQISIDRPLEVDYEKKKTMTVQVVASDPSIPGEDCCSTATVTIQINDTNDNSPTFKNETYMLKVKEHSAVGTIIDTITATDPDTEDIGEITYSLASGSILQYFAVDPNNGSIMVNSKNVDRETRSTYTATLQATDTAGQMGFTTLEITVLDINDKTPEILREEYDGYMFEGPGQKLEIQIQARDDDEEGTDNEKLRYRIMPSEFSQNFTIDEDTGKLENIGPLDRESIDPLAKGFIELTVMVNDLGVPSLSSNVTVLIEVEDINDNTPEFRNHNYIFYVKESIKGAFVGSVFAYDADQVYNRISFDITESGSARFLVVALQEGEGKGYTGNISVDQDIELDYEQQKKYKFKVVASDIDRRKDVASVEVHVLDVNDERPKLPSGLSMQVKENTNKTVVGSVIGQDMDSNHNLTYELLSSKCRCKGVMGSCKEEWFNLLPTGEVAVNPEFVIDYEACDQVLLDLQVVDILTEKGPNNSLPGLLQIDIEDVNDNVPQFIISEALFIVVNEKTEQTTSVAVVTATDLDSEKNKDITFSILTMEFVSTDNQISREALFYVDTDVKEDAYVGTVRTVGTLDSERKGKYLVTVQAANSAVEPQLKNSTLLEIYTIDSSFRVELYFEPPVDQINENIDEIRSTLSDATKATVHILRTVAVSSEQRATPLTLLEVYFVYLNGTAIQSEAVEKILQEDLYHANILRNLGLAGIVSGVTDPKVVDPLQYILLGLVGGLLVVLIVMVTSLVCTQRNYKRKLKAAKALNLAAMVATENQKPSAIVPGTNQMKANPVLNLNIDTTTDLGFDEEDSSTDRVSVNSLDYNIDIDMPEKDTAPMMVIEEENEEMEDHLYIEPLDFALAARGDKKRAPEVPHSFVNPTLDTTDL